MREGRVEGWDECVATNDVETEHSLPPSSSPSPPYSSGSSSCLLAALSMFSLRSPRERTGLIFYLNFFTIITTTILIIIIILNNVYLSFIFQYIIYFNREVVLLFA